MTDKVTLDGLRDVRVFQHCEGYRFSVDALLLYAFADVKHVRVIADLGAGSGIVGLLLARRYEKAKVVLFELQKSLFRLAEKSILLNGVDDRVRAVCTDLADIRSAEEPGSFDMVVSNPPYRRPKSGRISEGEEKAVARHEIKLDLRILAGAASYLLRGKGRFFMIYHPERLIEAFDRLRAYALEPKRVRFVHNDPASVSKIVLIECVKDGKPGLRIESPLFIYKEDGTYTSEVRGYYGHK